MDSYGVRFTSTSTLWKLLELVSLIEEVWPIMSNCDLHTLLWHGWILVYISSIWFNIISFIQDERDPVWKIKALSVTKLTKKVNCAEVDIALILSDGNGAIFLDWINIMELILI